MYIDITIDYMLISTGPLSLHMIVAFSQAAQHTPGPTMDGGPNLSEITRPRASNVVQCSCYQAHRDVSH